MLKIADRVQEVTTTVSTGTVTLGGAVVGYQTFANAFSVGDQTYYCIAGQATTEWEVGIGTLASSSTLTRDVILASSNSNNVVNFAAGIKDVYCTAPACLAPKGDLVTLANTFGAL